MITTIGYGQIAPSTTAGRIACLIYAVFGICLFVIFSTAWLKIWKRYLGSLKQTAKNYHIPLILTKIFFTLAYTTIFIVVPISVWSYKYVESWSIVNSLYYTVITLSTVGFGDFVPGKQHNDDEVDSFYHGCGEYECITLMWMIPGVIFTEFMKEKLCDLLITNVFDPFCMFTQKMRSYVLNTKQQTISPNYGKKKLLESSWDFENKTVVREL